MIRTRLSAVAFFVLICFTLASATVIEFPADRLTNTKTVNGTTITAIPLYNVIPDHYSDHYYYLNYPSSKTPETVNLTLNDVVTENGITVIDIGVAPILSIQNITYNETRYNHTDVDDTIEYENCYIESNCTMMNVTYNESGFDEYGNITYYNHTCEEPVCYPYETCDYYNITTTNTTITEYNVSQVYTQITIGEEGIINNSLYEEYVIRLRTDVFTNDAFNITIGADILDPEIDACGDLSTANEVYTLNQSVDNSGATCFTISAANITLDCAGFSITGDNSSDTYGVYSDQFNTTIKNCNISNFSEAIRLYGATDGLLQNNTLRTTFNHGYGIRFLNNAHRNNITQIAFTSQNSTAIIVQSGSNVSIDCGGYNLTGNNSTATYGIYSWEFNTTAKNCVIQNFTIGVLFVGATNGTIENVTADTTSSGTGYPLHASAILLAQGANYNRVYDSNFSSESGYTVRIAENSYYNNFNNFTATTASGTGITLFASENNTLTNFTSSSTGYSALYLSDSSNNTFSDFNATSTGTATTAFAIYVCDTSSNNTFSSFNATASNRNAVYLRTSADDNTLYNFSATSDAAGYYGIILESSNYNSIFNFTANSTVNSYAVYLTGSSHNNITDFSMAGSYAAVALFTSSNSNNVSNFNSTMPGGTVAILGSTNNRVFNFTANSTDTGADGRYGVWLKDGANNNTLYDFKAAAMTTSNTYSGLYVSDSNYNNISDFTAYAAGRDGVYLYSSNYNNLTNFNTSADGQFGLETRDSDNNTFHNFNANSTAALYSSMKIHTSQNNSLSNFNTSSTGAGAAIEISVQSSNNTISNFGATASGAGGRGVYFYQASENNISNFTSDANSYAISFYYQASDPEHSDNNIISNGTLSSTSADLIRINASAGSGNTFYWMNFTNTTGYYVNDAAGGNYYNATTPLGTNEGNIWFNVINGSVEIMGGTPSLGYPSLYVGIAGNGYPYNNSTSSKILGDVVDYAPLTNSTGCDCGVISTPNYRCELMVNRTSVGACMDVQADNVTIDCNSFTITAGLEAVVTNGYNNLTIFNCSAYSDATTFVIQNSNYSTIDCDGLNSSADIENVLYISDAVDFTVRNCEFTSGDTPIAMSNMETPLIENCVIHGLSNDGISIAASNLATINSTTINSADYGIDLFTSTNSVIDLVSAVGANATDSVGVYSEGDNTTTINSNISNYSVAVFYLNNDGGLIENVYGEISMPDSGVFGFDTSNYNTLRNCTAETNVPSGEFAGGIFVGGSNNNIFNFTAYGTGGGVIMQEGENNTVIDTNINVEGLAFMAETEINVSVSNAYLNSTLGMAFYLNNSHSVNYNSLTIYSNESPYLGDSETITITNSYFNGTDNGALLIYSLTNLALTNITANAQTDAVYLQHSNTTVFQNCSIIGNNYGLLLLHSNNILINDSSVFTNENNTLYLANATNTSVYDTSFNATNADAISIYEVSNSIFANLSISALNKAFFIRNSNTTAILDCNSSSDEIGLQLQDTITADVAGNSFTVGGLDALYLYNSTNNTIFNNTFTSDNNPVVHFGNYTTDSTFYFNTVITTADTTLLSVAELAGNNSFYLNNFTDTASTYASDLNGTNYYNVTYDGKNQGNIWFNVINNTVAVFGTVDSSYPGLYIGAYGSGYPYNSSTSLGKISGFTDYAPLTNQSNVPPTINSSRIGSVVLYTGQNMLGYCNASDLNGDPLTYYWKFFKNGVLFSSGSAGTFAESTEVNVANVSASDVKSGDWIFECMANDGIVNSSTMNSSQLQLNSCFDLTIAGQTYTLNENASVNGSTCYNVNASNIVLDCVGFSVTGNNSTGTTGIYSNRLNTTIRNCVISLFEDGIKFSGATYGRIENTNVSTDRGFGIILRDTSLYNNITNVNVSTKLNQGIYIYNSNFNIVSDTYSDVSLSAGAHAFYLNGAISNNLTNISGSGNPTSGYLVYITGSVNNRITNATSISGTGIIQNTGSSHNTQINRMTNIGQVLIGINNNGGSNVSIDCQGASLIGTNASSSYGVYSSQSNTTVKNCNISKFNAGVYFNGATGTITNNTINITSSNAVSPHWASAIMLISGTATIDSNRGYSTAGRGLMVYTGAVANITKNIFTTGNNPALSLSTAGSACIVVGNNLTSAVVLAGGFGALHMHNTYNHIIANNTINMTAGTAAVGMTTTGTVSNSQFINNTLIGAAATALVNISSTSTNNTFYWNNFTAAPNLYVDDLNGGNYYNATTPYATNEGNFWANVLDHSVSIGGATSSAISGYYIGSNGAGYPYNSTTSLGKVSAYVVDYAPLTDIFNTLPNITAISVIPPQPNKTTNISCNITVVDGEQTSFNVSYEWYLNGVNQTSLAGIYIGLVNDTPTLISNLTSGNFSAGQNWSCRARAFDSIDYSTWNMSANTTIQNAVPSILHELSFVNYTIGHSFNVSAGVTDLDGAADIALTNISTTEGSCVYASNVSSGNNLNVTYTCTGVYTSTATVIIGFTDSASAYADTAPASNAYPDNAPALTQPTITPIPAYVNDSLTCNNGTFSDVDGDTENVSSRTWIWYKNGIVIAGETANTLGTGNYSKGDNISCRETVFANNWTAYNATNISDNLTISNSNPVILHKLSFVNYTIGHSFNVSAGVYDYDGAADINTTNISITDGTCVYLSNSSIGNDFNVTYNCTGTYTSTPTVFIGFTDLSGSYVETAPASNKYPDNVPSLTEPNITPTTAYVTTTLTCNNGSFSDIDGDIENETSRTWTWYVNGVLVAGETSQTLAPGSFLKHYNVSCEETVFAQNWTDYNATNMSANISIQNTPPTIPNQLFPPHESVQTQLYPNINLTWNYSTDVDNDSITYDVCWGTVIPDNCSTTSGLYYTLNGSFNVTYFWNVSAFDGENYSGQTPTWNFSMNESFTQTNGTEIQIGYATANTTPYWYVDINVTGVGTCNYSIYHLGVQPGTIIHTNLGGVVTNLGTDANPIWNCNASMSPYNITFATETVYEYIYSDLSIAGILGNIHEKILLQTQYNQTIKYNFTYTLPSDFTSVRKYTCDDITNASCDVMAPWTLVDMSAPINLTVIELMNTTSNETVFALGIQTTTWLSGGGGGVPYYPPTVNETNETLVNVTISDSTTLLAGAPEEERTAEIAGISFLKEDLRKPIVGNLSVGHVLLGLVALVEIASFKFTAGLLKYVKFVWLAVLLVIILLVLPEIVLIPT